MKFGILFGGRSYEREISVITAAEVAAVLGEEAVSVYANEGSFYLLRGRWTVRDFAAGRVKMRKVRFDSVNGRGCIVKGRRKIFIDCMIMCCHGGEGEDGRFSALMEVYNIPYTASAPLPSALTMDKSISKVLFEEYGFPCARGVTVRRGEDALSVAKNLTYPLIVKPARLGSSIGISVARDETETIEALATAYSYDESVVIEEFIQGATELNCAAFVEGGSVVVSDVEIPSAWHEYLTFEDKYKCGKYKFGSHKRPDGTLRARVREETERVYRALGLFGIARIDFLYSPNDDLLYVNEINSQPGSLAYYLFEDVGVDFHSLLERVASASVERFQRKDIIQFNSGVLDNLCELHAK